MNKFFLIFLLFVSSIAWGVVYETKVYCKSLDAMIPMSDYQAGICPSEEEYETPDAPASTATEPRGTPAAEPKGESTAATQPASAGSCEDGNDEHTCPDGKIICLRNISPESNQQTINSLCGGSNQNTASSGVEPPGDPCVEAKKATVGICEADSKGDVSRAKSIMARFSASGSGGAICSEVGNLATIANAGLSAFQAGCTDEYESCISACSQTPPDPKLATVYKKNKSACTTAKNKVMPDLLMAMKGLSGVTNTCNAYLGQIGMPLITAQKAGDCAANPADPVCQCFLNPAMCKGGQPGQYAGGTGGVTTGADGDGGLPNANALGGPGGPPGMMGEGGLDPFNKPDGSGGSNPNRSGSGGGGGIYSADGGSGSRGRGARGMADASSPRIYGGFVGGAGGGTTAGGGGYGSAKKGKSAPGSNVAGGRFDWRKYLPEKLKSRFPSEAIDAESTGEFAGRSTNIFVNMNIRYQALRSTLRP